MPIKKPLPKILQTEAQEYAKLVELNRDSTNAVNRQKTKLRNAVKAFWFSEDLPIGSFARTAGFDIKYEASSSLKLDATKLVEMYDNEEISREDFVKMINVDKTQAKNVLGGDIVASMEYEQIGKTADIRLENTPIENIDDEFVIVATKIRSRVKRKTFGPKKSEATGKVRRKIKVGNK